jgi:endonuclease/exonuclease/phosphatase family metal-dependent hydrolase
MKTLRRSSSVHRVFARGVGPHELLERSASRRYVVIHVHLGIGGESRVQQVDELFETSPLAAAVVRQMGR